MQAPNQQYDHGGKPSCVEMAWSKGYKKIMIQRDSLETINWMQCRDIPRELLRNIMEDYKRWINRVWDVSLKDVYQKQNEVADALAKMAANMAKRDRDLGEPPQEIGMHLYKDRNDRPRTKLIRDYNQ